MIDRLVLTRRIEEIDKHLAKIEPYARHSLDDFLGDSVMQDVVEYNLFQISRKVARRLRILSGKLQKNSFDVNIFPAS